MLSEYKTSVSFPRVKLLYNDHISPISDFMVKHLAAFIGHLAAFSDTTWQHCAACPCQNLHDGHDETMTNHDYFTTTEILLMRIKGQWKETEVWDD